MVTSWVAVGQRCGEEEEADLEKHYDGMIEYYFLVLLFIYLFYLYIYIFLKLAGNFEWDALSPFKPKVRVLCHLYSRAHIYSNDYLSCSYKAVEEQFACS